MNKPKILHFFPFYRNVLNSISIIPEVTKNTVHNNKGFNDSVATMIHFGFQLPSDSRSWFNREQVVREEKSKIAFLIENCISLS